MTELLACKVWICPAISASLFLIICISLSISASLPLTPSTGTVAALLERESFGMQSVTEEELLILHVYSPLMKGFGTARAN